MRILWKLVQEDPLGADGAFFARLPIGLALSSPGGEFGGMCAWRRCHVDGCLVNEVAVREERKRETDKVGCAETRLPSSRMK